MPSTEQIDPNLKDATGSNNDLGIRGRRGNWLYFDGSLFVLQYNNRIGRITRLNDQGTAVTVKTNVGNSVSTGIEGILDIGNKTVETISKIIDKLSMINI